MKQLLIIFTLLCASPAIADHHYWTYHSTSSQPRETLRRDLMLVHTGSNDGWIIDWNNRLMDLWMAPDKNTDVVGYFQASVSVKPLLKSKAVCDIVQPTLSDYQAATRMRWALKRAVARKVGVSNTLTYLGNAWFPMTTTVPYKSTRGAWIYGLHSWEGLHTRVPAGGYFLPTTFDIRDHAECSYQVGAFKLRFERGLPTHNPGISEIAIGGVSMMRWSDEGGQPRKYRANTSRLTVRGVCAIVAVQRKGDANLDGKVDGMDVAPFIQAFNQPLMYETLHYGVPPRFNCDMNWDGMVNGLDVGLFMNAVLNNGVTGDYWDSIGYGK